MRISLIAALSKNGVIAHERGGIPWSLPRDKRHFRSYTANKWMLLGRATYEEMSGWFETQTPLILIRQVDYETPIASHRIVRSVSEAIELARGNGVGELVVSGGASVYEATLPFVDRLVLSRVDSEILEGIVFPDYGDDSDWCLVHRELWPADEENAFAIELRILDRRRQI